MILTSIPTIFLKCVHQLSFDFHRFMRKQVGTSLCVPVPLVDWLGQVAYISMELPLASLCVEQEK